jgi:hexosaminidase
MRNPVSSFPLMLLLALLLSTIAASAAATPSPSLIPKPASLELGRGEFIVDAATAIRIRTGDPEQQAAADYLSDLVFRSHGLRLPVTTQRVRGSVIELRLAQRTAAPESYVLEVRRGRARITAHSREGLLHGTRTFWQLLDRSNASMPLSAPALRIDDAPRFVWRGMMLDSARHYQSPQFVRDYIDWMALHKLNVLHWHLTDDQAWRLEIKKYPRLTDIAAWRVPAGRAAAADIDPATGQPRRHGGFYSQDEVRAIVAHAQARGVRIVPEIEMPGHASAPLAAYPQFAASAQPPKDVPADWGIYSHVYAVDDATFDFLEDVLDEVMALFPGEWIHIGGDEVEKHEWADSPQAQARMRELGLTEPKGLQGYFTQRIGRYLQSHGRRLVGWDEILEPGLADNAIVMSWRGVDGAMAATAKGYDSVLSPWPTLYFDNRQGSGGDEPPGRLRTISLEDVYRFDPLPDTMTAAQAQHLLGVQGNVWTEHIRTEPRVGWMTFPRAAAIAEMGWSQPEHRDWNDFLKRLPAQFARYDALGIPYADSVFAVQMKSQYQAGATQVEVALSKQAALGDIRYTLDGSAPTAGSPRYAEVLKLTPPQQLHAAAFVGTQRLSRPRAFALSANASLRRSSAELKLCSEDIALGLEDEAPLTGTRAIFRLDIQNPCWIFEQADLDGIDRIAAMTGDVPFNFQIGEAAKKIRLAAPESDNGELLVHLDRCDGPLIARIPLPALTASGPATILSAGALQPQHGRHDLCLRFAQRGIDPMRAIDWVQLLPVEASTGAN